MPRQTLLQPDPSQPSELIREFLNAAYAFADPALANGASNGSTIDRSIRAAIPAKAQLNSSQAAEYLGISKHTIITQWCPSGRDRRLPAAGIEPPKRRGEGHKTYFLRQDLDAYRAARARAGSPLIGKPR